MKKYLIRSAIPVIMLLLAGCSLPGAAPLTRLATLTPPMAAMPNLSPTLSRLPSLTATLAPTATLVLPLALGTPLPQFSDPISSDNINDIIEIANWGGQGVPVWRAAFLPDGRVLAAGASGNIVTLWDLSGAGEPITFSGQVETVATVAFSPDGKTLASGSLDGTIKLWDVASGQELHTFSVFRNDLNFFGVLDIVFSPDGSKLASVSESFRDSDFFFYLDLWDAASGTRVRSWGKNYILGVAFSPDGQMLAFGNGGKYFYKDNVVLLTDVVSGGTVHTFSGFEARVNTVAFSPDSRILASGSDDGTIRLWDVTSGSELHTLSNTINSPGEDEYSAAVMGIAFSPDGKTLVSWSEPGGFGVQSYTIKFWEVASGQEIGAVSGYSGAVSSVAFSPDGKFIMSNAGDGTIQLWGVSP